MATKFEASYYVKETKTSGAFRKIEISWPEDNHRSTLYLEEKQHRRISRMISSLTGWPIDAIRLEELKPLN